MHFFSTEHHTRLVTLGGEEEANLSVQKNTTRLVTSAELAAHCHPTDGGWIALHGVVYDVTRYASSHPGGTAILPLGTDASDRFELFHPPSVARRLRSLPRVGTLVDDARHDATLASYRALRRELWAEGAFVPCARYFAIKQAIVVALFALALLLPRLAPPDSSLPSLRLVAAPALLGLALQQAAFLAHDLAHNGVLPSRGVTAWRAPALEFNGGVLFGVSCAMWLAEHNMHHAYTLRPHVDPQFRYFPLWLQSSKEIPIWRDLLSSPPRMRRALAHATVCLVRAQHLTWLPLCIVVGRVNLLALSVAYAVSHRAWRDLLALTLHAAWMSWLLAACFHTWRERAVFVLVHYAAVGVLHVQLLVSHLMTVQMTAEEERHAAGGFVHVQLATTRNLRSCWATHWLHGGLDLQIEHHLFPQLPRHRLSAVAPRVRALAARHGLPYVEMSFVEAVGRCLGGLRELSTALVCADFV